MADLKGSLGRPTSVQAKTVAVGSPARLTELVDIDASQLDDGAMIVYELSTQKFSIRNEVDNTSTKIIGGKY